MPFTAVITSVERPVPLHYRYVLTPLHETIADLHAAGYLALTIPKEFGGGGHKNAAGLTVSGPIEELQKTLVAKIERAEAIPVLQEILDASEGQGLGAHAALVEAALADRHLHDAAHGAVEQRADSQ